MENKHISISGIRVDMIQIPRVLKKMQDLISKRESGNYIVVTNAYDLVMNSRNSKMKRASNDSFLTVPDGISLIWAARLWGHKLEKRVYGPDLMHEFLNLSQTKGYKHFFYGSTPDTLRQLAARLKEEFPELQIAGSYSPPFKELTDSEKDQIAAIINGSQADVVWVGLGTPKQQLFMYDFKDRLKAPVMVGTGAAFDFLAKTKKQAPRFIRDNGFEWLFRLVTEPKRLWKRYLVGNSRFLLLFIREFVKVRILRRK